MEHIVLLKSVLVWDPRGPWHNQCVDILLKQGIVESVGASLEAPEGCQILQHEGSMVSPGWIDGQVHFREPGEETKEGLHAGLQAASAGGFCHVAVLPSTTPPMDGAAAMQWVHAATQRANDSGVPAKALPMACMTERREGKQLTEMHDLQQAGAVAFTDDAPIDRPGLLQRALTYAQTHGLTVIDQPHDGDLNAGGVMHEGVASTSMGLTGSPAEAESIRVARDLDILRYTGGRLHLAVLSSRKGVELVREAKAEGLAVTCGTSAAHLMCCDEDLQGFNGLLRNTPPYRSKDDQIALVNGVMDGTIDVVVSDHRPENLESHDVEFMLSPDGMASLPSAFALAWTGLTNAVEGQDKALTALMHALTTRPARQFGIQLPTLQEGEPVCMTWFHPNAPHQPGEGTRGANLFEDSTKLRGSVLGVFHGARSSVA